MRQMLDRDLIDREELRRRFEQIEPQLYRYPAIAPAAFRRAVEEIPASKRLLTLTPPRPEPARA